MAPSKKVSASIVREEIELCRKRWGWTPSDIINMLRGGGSSGKGSEYERDVCRWLSLWWTDNQRDDVFWRSSGSGARAKVRGRAGRATAGQHGDVAATDPIGKPLIDMFTIEIKRGYSEYTVQDLLDRQVAGGVQEWDNFFAQAIESAEHAKSFSWLLITRRDRRRPLVWMPVETLHELRSGGAWDGPKPTPYVGIRTTVRFQGCGESRVVDICGMTLDEWLLSVNPDVIRSLMEGQ